MLSSEINSSLDDRQWYVIYTRPRFEKKIHKNLERLGLDSYLPTYSSLRQWKDRKKKVEMLLFPCYLFVNISDRQMWEVLSVSGVLQFLTQEGTPVAVPEDEINTIRKLQSGKPEVVNELVMRGEKIRIVRGPLKGMSGEVTKVKGKLKLGVKIEVINKLVLVEVAASDIELINKSDQSSGHAMASVA